MVPKLIYGLIILHLQLVYLNRNRQISLDGIMDPAQNLVGSSYTISHDLGILEGTNLFHCLSELNIHSGQSATFTSPDSIANVFSRVTGGNPSNIDGLLRSTIQDANLYFLIPSGVMFGPKVQLDVDGSFIVSTADCVRDSDKGHFYVIDVEASILTASALETFGFLGYAPASLSISGKTLSGSDHNSLSIISGKVTIENANLQGGSGDINIVGVGSAGEVIFDGVSNSDELGIDSIADLISDINMRNKCV